MTAERCAAEVGRRGSEHSCRKPARYWIRTKRSGMVLGYCADHVKRAGDDRYTGPIVAGPSERKGQV